MNANQIILAIDQSASTILTLKDQASNIGWICEVVVNALKRGNKVLTAGNGGSAAEAMHMSEELVGRYRSNRVSLPSVSLVADSTTLTCISNDFGYDAVFSRQVEGLGKPGDILVLFSSSGKGDALLNAARAAKAREVHVIGLLGRDGGPLAPLCDSTVIVPGTATERIQEAHQVLMHIILDSVEESFV